MKADPIGLAGGINPFLYSWANPINFIDPFGLDVWVYNYRKGGRGYGHTGLIMPNDDGTYTRYSQGADNPKAPAWQLKKLYIPYYEVCYDDCTGEEISREYLGRGDTGKTEEVMLKMLDVTASL